MDFPELHRKYESSPMYETKPPLRPGGLPRRGDRYFNGFIAYMLGASKLSIITIWAKPNQDFNAYATSFEKAWSKLVTSRNALNPVVDINLNVIGHTGEIDCGSIIIPRGVNPCAECLSFLLKAEIMFFVGHYPPDDSWMRYMPKAYTEAARVTVVTGIDGRVLAVSDVRIAGAGAESEAVSPLDIITGAFFIVKGIANLGATMTRLLVKSLARKSAGAGVAKVITLTGPTTELAKQGLSRARLFAKPKTAGSTGLPPGAGRTDKFGNVVYSTLGSAEDVALARLHEKVHQFFSPKLKFLLELRADIGMGAYNRSKLVKYLEEALAETRAQLGVYGFKGLPTGIAFPIKEGYVTLSAVAIEGAIATISVGGTIYGVYYWASK